MNPTTLSSFVTACATGTFLVCVALIGGVLTFKASTQKNKNDFTTATWDNWRKDNDQLSKQLEAARTKNGELVKAAEMADDARKAEKTAREKAEEERDTFRAACEIFGGLFAELVKGRIPSAEKLERITTRLLDVGYVFRP